MADKEKWGQHLDKIAYAVAGLAGLIVLAVPLLFSGQPRDAESEEELGKLRERIDGQPPRLAAEQQKELQSDAVREAVAKQWAVGEAGKSDPTWVTERAPLLVKKIPKPAPVAAVHNPGTVSEIACARDLEKKAPYLTVKGAIGEGNLNIVLRKVTLLRREEGGEFAPVAAFAEANPPAKIAKGFDFKDYGVVPGKAYTYQLLTSAVKDPKAPSQVAALEGAEAEKNSEPLGPAVVPHDFRIEISNIDPPKEADQGPQVRAKLAYWDYQAGKAVEWKGGAPDYFREGQKFGNDRYDFFRIDDLAGKVTIRELDSTVKYEITIKESRVPRPVTCEEPVTLESLKAKAEALEALEAEKQKKKEEADALKNLKTKGGKPKGKKSPKSTKEKEKPKSGAATSGGSASKPKPSTPEDTQKKKKFE